MKMSKNIGLADRIIRLVMGVVFIILGMIVVKGMVGLIFIALSIPLLASALLGFCPAYTLWGFSTKRDSDCC